MVYKFLLLSDEVEDFRREIEIDADATFLQFHEVIQKCAGYTQKEITSFFICNEAWEKEQEILLFDMGASSDEDTYLMSETRLSDLISDKGQRLLYVFDNLNERSFFVELKKITTGSDLAEPVCTLSKGKAPAQTVDMEAFANKISTDIDPEFYGGDDFDPDEIDEEGFGNMSFDENGNEVY